MIDFLINRNIYDLDEGVIDNILFCFDKIIKGQEGTNSFNFFYEMREIILANKDLLGFIDSEEPESDFNQIIKFFIGEEFGEELGEELDKDIGYYHKINSIVDKEYYENILVEIRRDNIFIDKNDIISTAPLITNMYEKNN